MRLAFALLISLCVYAQQPGRGGAGQPPAPPQTIEQRTAGMQKLDGYFPLVLGRAHRQPLPRDSALRHRVPLYTRASPPGSARTTSGSTADRRAAASSSRSSASVRACCWCSRTSRSARRAPIRRSANPWRTPSRSRCSGASRWRRRATAACWWTPPISSCATDTAPASSLGGYRVDRTRSAVYMPRTKAFPKNTEIEVTLTFANEGAPADAAARRRTEQGPPPIQTGAPAGGRGGAAGAAAACSPARVASVTPTAEAVTLREHYSLVELPDGNYKPRYDDPRAGYGGLSFVDYSAPIGEPMVKRYIRRHRLEKTRPERRGQRAGEADRVLGRSRRAGGRAEGAGRGRELVEPGVRGGRLPQRLPGRRAARRRRPDGHPLQHDQLGAPLDARLEHGRHGQRSAHRRDHQGHRHARLAARPAGLPDLRRAALALHDRHREAGHPVPDGARAHPPARRARSRAHARARPQLLRQHQGLDLGDGLSASAREAAGGRHDRPLGRLPGAHRRLGQGRDQLRLSPVPEGRGHRRAHHASSTTRGRRTCAT